MNDIKQLTESVSNIADELTKISIAKIDTSKTSSNAKYQIGRGILIGGLVTLAGVQTYRKFLKPKINSIK